MTEIVAGPGPDQLAALLAAAGPSVWARSVDPVHGAAVGAAPGVLVTLLPDGERKLWIKRAVRGALTPAARLVEALVAELDGVRVYVMAGEAGQPVRVVVTRQDLNL